MTCRRCAFVAVLCLALCMACSGEREVRVAFDDTRMGRVEIRGVLHPARDAKRVLVIVHGLGDDHEAPSIKQAADEANALGWATLRVSMRGADKSGQGLYFAGDADSIAQAVAAPALAKYDTVAILGFSLGAHNVLRYLARHEAGAKPDPRVKAVVAVSAPLELRKTAPILDASPYVASVLASLSAQYRPFHDEMMKRGKLQWLPSPARVEKFKAVKQFDDEVVAPVLGHKDATDYYAKESVAPEHLKHIRVPVAIVAGTGDPLVPIVLVREALRDPAAAVPPHVRLFEVDGGHITLSPSMTMKQRAPDGLMTQALAWVETVLSSSG